MRATSQSPSRSTSLPVVEAKLLEPVKLTWADARDAAAKAGALAIGPGLGRDAAAKALRDELLGAGDQTLVLDADALHELEPGDWGARAVLTPHAGELGRLLGESSGWVDAHRLEAARRGAERFGCVCLLKGADTIVAAPAQGVARLRRRGAGARDGRHRRRPDRDPRRVPRQGPRAAPRRGGRGDGARPRCAAPAAARPRRERRHLGAARRARLTPVELPRSAVAHAQADLGLPADGQPLRDADPAAADAATRLDV